MERIVGTSMLLGGWRPATPWIALTNVFSFADEAGGTRLTACAMHATADSVEQHRQMGFFDGWGTMLAQWDAFSAELPG
jgi:uncharacterized protein YndB with AHSA1/START domain